jgi:hypothetical protein
MHDDRFYVLHEFFWPLEDIVVDTLEKVAVLCALRSAELGCVGVVNVAGAIGVSPQEFTFEAEALDDVLELGLHGSFFTFD